MEAPAEGTPAPDFTLQTDQDTTFTLSAQRGHPVVLFFYPEDDTEGCTVENLEFTALMPEFKRLGADVVGISPDSVAKHCAFRDKYQLGVLLAADPDHQAIGPYNIWRLKKNYGREYKGAVRTTFIIAPDGKIAKILPATRIKRHAETALRELTTLSASWSV